MPSVIMRRGEGVLEGLGSAAGPEVESAAIALTLFS